MSEEKTANNQLSDEDIATIKNAIEQLEEILYTRITLIRAAIDGELPGKDIRRWSTIEEIMRAMEQIKEINTEMAKIASGMHDQYLLSLDCAYQKALAYFHEVEDAARKNVSGAQEIYDDLKKYLPDEYNLMEVRNLREVEAGQENTNRK